jgi:transcriptional regulator with XRE-family HTH domain
MAAEQLRRWLDENGITQMAFADLLNKASRKVKVDQTEVSRWVRSRRLPNAEEQRAIEKVTGIARSAWAHARVVECSE